MNDAAQEVRFSLMERDGATIVTTELIDWIGHESHGVANRSPRPALDPVQCGCGDTLENQGVERILHEGEDPAEVASELDTQAREQFQHVVIRRAEKLLWQAVNEIAAGRDPLTPEGYWISSFGTGITIDLEHGPDLNGLPEDLIGFSTEGMGLTTQQREGVARWVAQ